MVKSFRLSPIVPVKVIDIYHSPTEIKRFVTKMTFDFDTQPKAGARLLNVIRPVATCSVERSTGLILTLKKTWTWLQKN